MFKMINSKEVMTQDEIRNKYGSYNVLYECTLDNVEEGCVVAISDEKDVIKLSTLQQEFFENNKAAYLLQRIHSECTFGDLVVTKWEVLSCFK